VQVAVGLQTETKVYSYTLFKSLGSLRKRKKNIAISVFFKEKNCFTLKNTEIAMFFPDEDNIKLIINALYTLW